MGLARMVSLLTVESISARFKFQIKYEYCIFMANYFFLLPSITLAAVHLYLMDQRLLRLLFTL
jgi:hypothetical protein